MVVIGGSSGELGYDDQDFADLDPDIRQMFSGEDAAAADESAGGF